MSLPASSTWRSPWDSATATSTRSSSSTIRSCSSPDPASSRKDHFPTPELNGASLVGYPPSVCQEDIENGLRACGADPTFVFRTLDNGAQVAMVKAGMGWAVMPLMAINTRDPEVDLRSLTPAIPPRQICLVWRRDRTLSPIASRMVDIATEVAATIRQLPLSA